MYQAWYLQHLQSCDDSLATSHDIVAFKIRHLSSTVEKVVLAEDTVFEWLNGCSRNDYVVRGLLMHHRRIATTAREILPRYMSLTKSTFKFASEALKVPPSYLYLRVNAAGSGTFRKYCERDNLGNITNISFILRVPHAPQNEVKSIWSLSLSWDLRRNTTDIWFDGITSSDLTEIEAYLNNASSKCEHPYAILIFLAELLNVYYTRMNQGFARDTHSLEVKLGITKGQASFQGWNWNPDTFRIYTQECYKLITGPVYLGRRLDFLLSLNSFFLDCLHTLQNDMAYHATRKEKVMLANADLIDVVQNNMNSVKCQLQYTRCLNDRIHNLMLTLNAIVAQVDSQTNLKIASATKHDSSSMLTVAFLTAFFLPPTFVCSFFDMSFFTFDSAQAQSIVSPLFWLYWAITIPLTAAVMISWRLWDARRERTTKTVLPL